MSNDDPLSLGLDFGTASVRALLVDLKGNEQGSAVVKYRHGQITETLPGGKETLPVDFALQHPRDWIDSSARGGPARSGRRGSMAGRFSASAWISPVAPCCQVARWHAALFSAGVCSASLCVAEALEASRGKVANRADQSRSTRTQGTVACSLRRNHRPGMVLSKNPRDLGGGPARFTRPPRLARGRRLVCLAIGRRRCRGVAALGLSGGLQGDVEPGRRLSLGRVLRGAASEDGPRRRRQDAGPHPFAGPMPARSHAAMAKRLGLRRDPVSAATIDAHAGVPGAVAEADSMVMVMGTSSCHMLNARKEVLVPGIAGVVQDGILPGFFGYETGQAAVGDVFDWLRTVLGNVVLAELTRQAALRWRGRCVLHGLVQRLSHAADGRHAAWGIYRSGPAPRPRATSTARPSKPRPMDSAGSLKSWRSMACA